MELDPIIHQPIRTRIISLLLREGSCDYNGIKNELGLTDGHMSTHMKALDKAAYVEVSKDFFDKKPRTTYRLSKEGKRAFQNYLKALRSIIDL